MDLKQYVSDAIRTESQIVEVKTNYVALVESLNIIIAAGTMLDLLKKNIFYGKQINVTQFESLSEHIQKATIRLKQIDLALVQRIEINPRVFHAIVGAITESAELAEALTKNLNGHTIDMVNILEEFGDINWYEAIAVDALGGDFQAILERNIAKLKERFPQQFTSENAINRNLDRERAILEGNVA